MANTHSTLTSLFTDIADVIRERTGRTEQIIADDFPEWVADTVDNGVLLSIIDKTVEDLDYSHLEGITSIGDYAFYRCTNLAFTSLPEGITSIGNSAFYRCTNLALTSLPEGITSIGGYAFDSCSNLKSIIFKGTPSSISSTAFSRCNKLTTINVPWAEGEVANAPWGATSATINYNYTGG